MDETPQNAKSSKQMQIAKSGCDLKEKNQHINVIVRSRPLSSSERRQGSYNVLTLNTEKREVVVREKLNSNLSKTFTFDKVFGPDSKQIDIYREVVTPLMDEVLMGYNCTVFAYGQTGTGKTFTMEGERSENMDISWEKDPLAGIIPRTLHHLFQSLTEQNAEFSVRVSFVELYNEELFDLLTSPEDTQRLRLYEDPTKKGSVVIQGLEEVAVTSRDEVYTILERGARKRQTAATLLNAQSSRSHSVFSVTVHIRESTIDGEELLKTGKFNLVDLAGSENIGRSGAMDKRAREAGQINQSLLTLGRVITALVEHAPHVPYRESKLTRLLQDSLGGRTKTSIIATVSPASVNLEETLSTLDYAHRAKNITNRPEVNQKLTRKALLKEYNEEIEKLRKDLAAAREKNGVFLHEDNYNQMTAQLADQEEKIAEREMRIAACDAEYERLNSLFSDAKKNLAATKSRLDKTTSRLVQAKERLHSARKDFLKAVHERDQQQFLVSEHSKTEVNLFARAEKLLEVSEKTTTELDLLHGKVESSRLADTHNQSALVEFEHNCSGHFHSLNGNLIQLQNSEKSVFQSAKEILDKYMRQSKINMENVDANVQRLSDNLQYQKDQLLMKVQAMSDVMVDGITADSHDFVKLHSELINAIQSFGDNCLKTVVTNVSKDLSEARENVSNVEKIWQEEHESLQRLLCIHISSQQYSLSQLRQAVKSHREDMIGHLAAAEIAVKEVSAKSIETNEKLKLAREALAAAELLQIQIHDQHMSNLLGISKEIERKESDIEKTVYNFEEESKKLTQSASLDSRKLLQLAKIEGQELLNANLAAFEVIGDRQNHLLTEMLQFESIMSLVLSDYSKKSEDKFSTRKSVVIGAVTDTTDFLNQNLIGCADRCTDVLMTHQNLSIDYQDFAAHMEFIFSSHKDEVDEWSRITDANLQNIQRHVKILRNGLKFERSTGTTPARTTYEYPKILPKTSPYATLIERFSQSNPPPNFDLSNLNDSLMEDSINNEIANKENAQIVCDNHAKLPLISLNQPKAPLLSSNQHS